MRFECGSETDGMACIVGRAADPVVRPVGSRRDARTGARNGIALNASDGIALAKG